MIRPMLRSLLVAVLFCAASLSPSLSAQVVPIPGTGCANQSQAPFGGTPTPGGSITVASSQFPCNTPGTSGFVAISLSCTAAPPQNWGCFGPLNPCVFLIPDISVSAPIRTSLTITIPNNPALVGAQFCVQSGCLATFLPPPPLAACFQQLNQALQVTIF